TKKKAARRKKPNGPCRKRRKRRKSSKRKKSKRLTDGPSHETPTPAAWPGFSFHRASIGLAGRRKFLICPCCQGSPLSLTWMHLTCEHPCRNVRHGRYYLSVRK